MKKIKLLLILLFTICFFTGCDATVVAEITDDSIKQTYSVNGIKSGEQSKVKWLNNKALDLYYTSEMLWELKPVEKSNKVVGIREYTLKEYDADGFLSLIFDDVEVNFQNGILLIDTAVGCSAFETYEELSHLKLQVKTNKTVLSSNADKINGDTYTWEITKDNAYNKKINIEVDTTVINNKIYYKYYIIGAIVLALAVIIFIKLKVSYEKNNII